LMTSAMQMLTGGGMMLVVGSLLGEWPRLLGQPVSTSSLLAFLYLTFVGGLVAFTTYAWLLRAASPKAVSTYAYVNPLGAGLLGWLLGGEELGVTVLAAALLVVGAVILITLPQAALLRTIPEERAAGRAAPREGQAGSPSYERSAIPCDACD